MDMIQSDLMMSASVKADSNPISLDIGSTLYFPSKLSIWIGTISPETDIS